MAILKGRFVGETLYSEGLRMQEIAHRSVSEGNPDQVILLEHPNVYTLGRRGDHQDILVGPDVIQKLKLEIFETDRGGEVTYHGPGQLVAYPIIDLRRLNQGPIEFVRKLETLTTSLLSTYNISATSVNKPTGVWIGNKKIASIGIKVSNKITSHGLALNINTDLSYFDHIIACGLAESQPTSLSKETNQTHDMKKIAYEMAVELATILGSDLQWDSTHPD